MLLCIRVDQACTARADFPLILHKPSSDCTNKKKHTHRATSASLPPPPLHRHYGEGTQRGQIKENLITGYALNIFSLPCSMLLLWRQAALRGELSVSPAHTQSLSCPRCGAERSAAICEPIEITSSQSTHKQEEDLKG